MRRRGPREFDRPRWLRAFFWLFLLFTFAPIAIVALFSFNETRSLQDFSGFSLQWYDEFFSSPTLRSSLLASVEVAAATTVVATLLGTALAYGLVRARGRIARTSNVMMLVPLVIPEIVAGVAALVFFAQIGVALSLATVTIAHITFSISFVTIIVRARLATMPHDIEEAALDLGATRLQTVRLVTLPELWPAIVASALLVFALSFDDFVLSFFTTGESPQPLPVQIYSSIRFGVSPTINAIGTLMLTISLVLLALAVALPRLSGRRDQQNVLLAGEGR